MSDLLASAPDACTLPTPERPFRVAEFDDLFRVVRAVDRSDATRLQLTLPPGPDVAAQAAGLVAREAACCTFYTFTLTVGSDSLRLLIEVTVAHVDVLDAMTEWVQAARQR